MTYSTPFGREDLAAVIDEIAQHEGKRVALFAPFGSDLIDWNDVACSDGGIPSLDHGQLDNSRCSIGGNRSLHGHIHQHGVIFHIDEADPKKSWVAHLLEDTLVPHGAVTGAALIGGATKSWAGALVGLGLGALLGSELSKMSAPVWTIGVDHNGRLVYERLGMLKGAGGFVRA